MPIRIYNSLTQRKEPFEPLTPGRVGMYACGVTVYDACHIGHARSAFVFDVIRRYLEYRGYRVKFVRNFTDVDDKIIARAAETGRAWDEVAEQYIGEYREDMQALGLRPADLEPRATEHIPQMIALIQALVARGLAYAVDGDVYFEVRKFAGYGKLSHRNLDELQAGARVETDERKRDPLDFALWKASKPGEPAWESPWGPGRPGWHIECSAMAAHHLGGQPFDIHGGGADLIFPHHENEIAQSEGASGTPLARTWMHHGLVNILATKMSKSLGNIVPLRQLLREHRADAIKLFFLQAHYRSPVDYSPEALGRAQRSLERLHECLAAVAGLRLGGPGGASEPIDPVRESIARLVEECEAAMDDDFNTPRAVGALFSLVREINSCMHALAPSGSASAALVGVLRAGVEKLAEVGRVLGLELRGARPPAADGSPDAQGRVAEGGRDFEYDAVILANLGEGKLRELLAKHADRDLGTGFDGLTAEQALIRLNAVRQAARARRDFRTADAIRDALAALGVDVRDRTEGTAWRWSGRGA